MLKKYPNNYWRKLDNTAKAFSLDDKISTNIFRYSVVLKDKIDIKILKNALIKSLSEYPSFKVKFGTGLFWNYFEFNSKEPIISIENETPCKYINLRKNNNYLFKITYYQKKINIDIFHALTDGTGAALFFKSIIYNYLGLKYNIPISKKSYNNISYQDQYLKNYDKTLKIVSNDCKKAYQFEGKIDKNINNTYHYIINIEKIKKVCKKYNVTITEYLTAIYIYALYLSVYKKESEKEIVVAVPINIRKYYQVNTLSNFFVCMNINPKIVEKKLTTLSEIKNQVRLEFKEKLNIDKVKSYLTRDVKLGSKISIRLVPLFLKKLIIRLISSQISKNSTTTLSNVGPIDIDSKFKQYIDNFYVLAKPCKNQKIRCTICSFDKKLNITMNSNIDDRKFENTFFNLLKKEFGSVKLKSNNTIDFMK